MLREKKILQDGVFVMSKGQVKMRSHTEILSMVTSGAHSLNYLLSMYHSLGSFGDWITRALTFEELIFWQDLNSPQNK